MAIYYKSVRLIDGRLKTIIKDENYNFIRQPTMEQIKFAIDEKYMPRKCCICGIVYDKYKMPHFYSHKCDKINCTEFLCNKCRCREYSPSQWRIGKLSNSCPTGKGFIGQQIVAKRYEVEDCNLKMDTFHFYVDLCKIPDYGYSEVKIRSLRYGVWNFGSFIPENFETAFILCMDKYYPWKNVERVYAIPSEYIDVATIRISKNNTRISRWEQFKIDDRSFNDIYHNMRLENCRYLIKN